MPNKLLNNPPSPSPSKSIIQYIFRNIKTRKTYQYKEINSYQYLLLLILSGVECMMHKSIRKYKFWFLCSINNNIQQKKRQRGICIIDFLKLLIFNTWQRERILQVEYIFTNPYLACYAKSNEFCSKRRKSHHYLEIQYYFTS